MSNIRILSEHLSNQIAAGEVVERPASVVKELLENSIDAGATQIDVQVEGGGLRLLRIADNGSGMVEDDVLLCFERHATSKIKEESQLNAIATLGFRGEAVPSIASVANMTVISRASNRELGTAVGLKYGVLHSVHEEGCARGTIIEVRNLFGNVPARKKFLKTYRTELFHIEEVIKNQAMANPEIGFGLLVDKRPIFEYQVGSDRENRLRQVFKYQGKLLSLEHCGATVDEEIQIGGLLLLPEEAPARSAKLRVFVNGRPVQDRIIRNGVTEGLQSFLMKGYQPAGAIFIHLPPYLVDVNVHPAKREIRFTDQRTVHRVVTSAVSQSLLQHQEQTRSNIFTSATAENKDQNLEKELFTAEQRSFSSTNLLKSNQKEEVFTPKRALESTYKPECRSEYVPSVKAQTSHVVVEKKNTFSNNELNDEGTEYQGLVLIGQLFSLYLLCQKQNKFIVIDQHAAHERILYGRYKQEYLNKEIPRQKLLFPVTIELGPDHIETAELHGEGLEWLGFEIDHFGDATWVIKSVPAVISILDPVMMLHDILDSLHGKPKDTKEAMASVLDDLLASMACKAAVKAGNKLEPEEMLDLLQQMEESQVFSHCPHGRPVIKVFGREELTKWFHRHGG